jgi:hypothetical protein
MAEADGARREAVEPDEGAMAIEGGDPAAVDLSDAGESRRRIADRLLGRNGPG